MQKRMTACAVVVGFCVFHSASVAQADEPPRPPQKAAEGIADAPGTDVVVLRNGGTIRGTFIEVLPGDHLTILLASGQTAIVKWIDIARFGDEAAPLPPPEPAPPPTLRNTKSKVLVHVESPRHVTLEHKAVASEEWNAVCESPCDRSLPRTGAYRIVGSDIVSSGDFDLQETADERIVLHVNPGTKSAHYGGIVAFGAGALVFLAGAVVVSGKRDDPAGDTAGTVAIVAGLTSMGVGAYLALAHWSTGQKQALEAPPEPARSASLFETKKRETAVSAAPFVGVPLFTRSF